MVLYALQRLVVFAATLVFASLVVFAVMNVLPGNAAQTMLGATATPEAVAALAHKLGLDQPAWLRYLHWIGGALTRRPRPLLRLWLADRPIDRLGARNQRPAGADGDGARRGRRAGGRRLSPRTGAAGSATSW